MATIAIPREADRPVLAESDPNMWDVLSLRDEAGEAKLGNCHLIVGDHTLEFVNGVAQAPEAVLPLLLADSRVKVPGYRGEAASGPPAAPSGTVDFADGATAPDALAEQLAEDEAALGAKGTTAPVAGRQPLTKDGQARCQATKADGAQCDNSAVEGHACGLSSHKSQLS